MEFIGELKKIMEPISGKSAKGEWKKQDFIFQTKDQYPKNICLTNWNNKVEMSQFNIGQTCKVYFDIESREYKDKWFTNVTMWKVESEGASNAPQPPDDIDVLPTADDYTFSDDEVLPF